MNVKEAIRAAEAYADNTVQLATHIRSSPNLAPIAEKIRAALYDADRFPMHERNLVREQVGKDYFDHMGLVVLTAENVRLWRKNSVIYRVHPGLADSLVESETQAAIPCDVFARLPHPDPFIAFPEPIPAPPVDSMLPMKEDQVCIGMLVTGISDKAVCSTADPRLTGLYVSLAIRLHYESNDHPTYEERSFTIPVQGKATIADMIVKNQEIFPDMSDDAGDVVALQLAVSLLLYLCSDRRDMRTPPAGPGKRERSKSRKDATVFDLGFDIGPKLFAARRNAVRDEAGEGIGNAVRPHIRRAHWHTFWTGTGRTTPVVRWLHPIVVHPEDQENGRPLVVDADVPDAS